MSLPRWKSFVLRHGFGARARDLAAVTGRTIAEIAALRATDAIQHGRRKGFAELFAAWHGREPEDADWPPPGKAGNDGYEWLAPETALLASLVGRISKAEISAVLTERLRRLTGDPAAARSLNAVQVGIQRIGMVCSDVVGGLTVADAAREIGSSAMVNQAIAKGSLPASKVGRLWIIPHDAWAGWKAARSFPPPGYVRLATLRKPLSIRSDKLSEFARMGHVPTAVRCNPYGSGERSTQYGTWHVSADVARQMLDDRQAGRPMPWHGKAVKGNLERTYALWLERRHPSSCAACKAIWGKQGAPQGLAAYGRRYEALDHGAKRHLTRAWSPGLTIAEVAARAGCHAHRVRRAVANGTLAATTEGGVARVTKTDATRWHARRCPTGANGKSWISLETASKAHQFDRRDLMRMVRDGTLRSKVGTQGAMRGITYVPFDQCAKLRARLGFSEAEAARRLGLPIPEMRKALKGLGWRGTDAIPLAAVQAMAKRLEAPRGRTAADAARELGRPEAWVEARIADGTIRLIGRKWDGRRPAISDPMMRRLREALDAPEPGPDPLAGWQGISATALDAGVSMATLQKWADAGEVIRAEGPDGLKYEPASVRARAAKHWATTRQRRARRPGWLADAGQDAR